MEAFSSANQLITEGVQAVTRRQAEIMRTNIEEAVRASKDIMSGGTPEAGIAKQTQYAKSLVENTINNVREVSEMVTKSNMEAFDLLNKRMLESIEEFSSAAATATAAAAPRK
jgi:phasin family protein